ncbi:hypothetical protein [Nesterenkonia ebinurensis]|uniref:hypothetical protein n=1 Tax=Nesterenkonia ebinurensis TaxID=2608252 RepID=UPI00123D3046|nr:hypothetical protein [Nesterenkonia ebinurensis]
MTISESIEDNWRGAYDLLVLSESEYVDEIGQSGELIQPNFSGLSGSREIDGELLERIYNLEDVAVAAPLAFVGQLENPSYGAMLIAGDPAGAESEYFERPRLTRIFVRVEHSDGLRDQESVDQELYLATGPGEEFPEAEAVGDGFNLAAGTFDEDSWMVAINVYAVPALSSGLIAVDPSAESELLGEFGGMIQNLGAFDDLRQTGEDERCVDFRGGENLNYEEVPRGECLDDFLDEELLGGTGMPHVGQYEYFDEDEQDYVPGPVIPVVVNQNAYPELRSVLAVEELNVPEEIAAEFLATGELSVDVDEAPIANEFSEEIRISEELTPFTMPYLSLSLIEGIEAPPGSSRTSEPAIQPRLVEPLRVDPDASESIEPPEAAEDAVMLAPLDSVALDQSSIREQAYRELNEIPGEVSGEPLFAPVGSYIPEELDDVVNHPSYAPLGTYVASEVTVIEENEYEGNTLEPSFSGQGIVLPPPGGITSFTAYEELRGGVAADVVRVRVEGVEDYSSQSISRIEAVAADISELGLTVRVVAGASMAPVGMYVPEYFADGSDLGWTLEEWTSLGAAVHVEETQMAASWTLLAIALIGVTALAVAVQLQNLSPRRREAAMLETQGWGQGRTLAWFLIEEAPAVVLLIAGAAAVALLGTRPGTMLGNWAALGAVILVIVVTTWFATSRSPYSSWRTRQRVTRPAARVSAMGRRIAYSSPGSMALTVMGVLILVAVSVTYVLVVASARLTSGMSRIADVVTSQLLLPQAVLGVAAAAAGMIMLLSGIRAQLHENNAQHRVLLTVGWTQQELGRMVRHQLFAAVLPAAVLAAAAGTGVGLIQDIGEYAPVVIAISAVMPAVVVAGAAWWAAHYAKELYAEYQVVV